MVYQTLIIYGLSNLNNMVNQTLIIYGLSNPNNNIWFIVHYCNDFMDKKNYIHMFVVFNKEMDLIGHSKPFKFRNCIVEYCMGMILNKKKSKQLHKFI